MLTYQGPPLERGGTSINAPVNRIATLLSPFIQPGMRVLDYGAGRYARFADHFRLRGVEVYAYDPYHSSGGDGRGTGSVVSKLPSGEEFDLAYSVYVLNVVPDHIEDKILAEMMSFAPKTVHVTRGTSIKNFAKKALERGGGGTYDFYVNEFAPLHPTAAEELASGQVSDDTLWDFAHFGYATPRGFQRVPRTASKGYSARGKEPMMFVG